MPSGSYVGGAAAGQFREGWGLFHDPRTQVKAGSREFFFRKQSLAN
jgi:hypothetical protein